MKDQTRQMNPEFNQNQVSLLPIILMTLFSQPNITTKLQETMSVLNSVTSTIQTLSSSMENINIGMNTIQQQLITTSNRKNNFNPNNK